MFYLFLIAIVLIAFLVFAMFIILKSSVNKMNEQTKLYFVDKLQDYNKMIDKKEEELRNLDEKINNVEINNIQSGTDSDRKSVDFDYNIINLLNKTEYQSENVLRLAKEIDRKFEFDCESVVRKFVDMTRDSEKVYNFCVEFRKKLDCNLIYKLKIMPDYDGYIKSNFTKNEVSLYNYFKLLYKKSSIDNFVNYLEELIDLNNPCVYVYVGDKQINFDRISKNIKTRYSSSIYKGIKILYRNRLYDFSLSEGNV